MLELSLRGFRIRITFAFFALLGITSSISAEYQRQLLTVLLCSFTHELGHIIAMTAFWLPPEGLTLYAGGMMLSAQTLNCSRKRAAVILLAGAFVNFASAMIGALLSAGECFAAVNLLLGTFNLLPFRYFDGGRLCECLTGSEPPLFVQLAAVSPLAVLAGFSVSRGSVPVSLIITVVIIISDSILNNGG